MTRERSISSPGFILRLVCLSFCLFERNAEDFVRVRTLDLGTGRQPGYIDELMGLSEWAAYKAFLVRNYFTKGDVCIGIG